MSSAPRAARTAPELQNLNLRRCARRRSAEVKIVICAHAHTKQRKSNVLRSRAVAEAAPAGLSSWKAAAQQDFSKRLAPGKPAGIQLQFFQNGLEKLRLLTCVRRCLVEGGDGSARPSSETAQAARRAPPRPPRAAAALLRACACRARGFLWRPLPTPLLVLPAPSRGPTSTEHDAQGPRCAAASEQRSSLGSTSCGPTAPAPAPTMYHDLSLSFPASASFPSASSSRSAQGAAGSAAKGKSKGKGKEKEPAATGTSAAAAQHDALAALSPEQHRRLHALTADMAEREYEDK